MRGDIRPLPSGKHPTPPGGTAVRRLAAITAGDIAGYSRLMGLDEEGTLARLKRIQRELIEPTIAEHHGRMIKTTGDGFLAIFDSPVEAVRCAIVIQQSMVGRNTSLPRQHWIVYRIGVNLGDVIVEPTDVYGDGVNIAVRLEGIAAPGEVYISGGVYEQIKNKLVCGYQSLGDRQVKNITDPVNVYRVLPDPAAVMRARRMRWPIGILAALYVSGIAVIVGTSWYWFTQQKQEMVQPPPPSAAPSAPQQATVPPPTPPVSQQAAPAPRPAPPVPQQTAPAPPPSPPVPQQAAPAPPPPAPPVTTTAPAPTEASKSGP